MKVLFLTGPTACGKSGLAFEIAKALKLEGRRVAILNCDSVQVYKGLSIGSAQPSSEEMAAIPHVLYGVIEAPQELTAGEFARLFLEELANLEGRCDLVIAVGGSGFYIQSILKGMFGADKAQESVQQKIFTEIRNPGVAEALHAELAAKDPMAAKRIHVNDHYRLVRAIEIIRSGASTVTELHAEKKQAGLQFGYEFEQWVIEIPRELLAARVKQRVERMLQNGFIQEVGKWLDNGFENWAPLNSVGYLQVKDFLLTTPSSGRAAALPMLVAKICTATMQLAKKQRTWFRRTTDYENRVVRWSFSELNFEAAMTKVRSFID